MSRLRATLELAGAALAFGAPSIVFAALVSAAAGASTAAMAAIAGAVFLAALALLAAIRRRVCR